MGGGALGEHPPVQFFPDTDGGNLSEIQHCLLGKRPKVVPSLGGDWGTRWGYPNSSESCQGEGGVPYQKFYGGGGKEML